MDKETVTYSNHLTFNGRKLAFKKQILFDITNTPIPIKQNERGWKIGREYLKISDAERLIIKEPIIIDLTGLQWNEQCNIQECFNLATPNK